MSRRFQFSLGRLLSAVALSSVALWLLRVALDSEGNEMRPVLAVLFIPVVLGSAIGRLFGRALAGATITAAIVFGLPTLFVGVVVAIKYFLLKELRF